MMETNDKTQKIVWHDDVVLKQMLSYAVGVWMGRYRLGKPVCISLTLNLRPRSWLLIPIMVIPLR